MEALLTSQEKLTPVQFKAVGLLSLGTFLEQFDIMLYIHMSVLLNDLFFPRTDPVVTSWISAFTFCSTFVFIPIGALIFGYIGDNLGRKATLVLTTLLTSSSCIMIAFLPTYNEIGIKASIIMIGCRITQSLASMGEVIGALIYITEFTKPPIRYYAVALIPILGYSGGLAALGVASLIIYAEINWRGIFIFGSLIALVGFSIRAQLSETRDFADANKRLKNQYNVQLNQDDFPIDDQNYKKTSLAMFCIQCSWPLCFYFVFIYCGQLLKNQFGYSTFEIIKHNFIISIFPVLSCFIRAKLSKKFHPLVLLKYSLIVSFFLFIITGFYLEKEFSALGMAILQSLLLMFTANGYSELSVMIPHISVFKRFKSTCLSYAFSRAFMYVITSFGLIIVIKSVGIMYGLMFATSCITAIGAYGYFYFLRLEQINKMIPIAKIK